MTDPETNRHVAPIPRSLQEQLDKFRQRLWQIKVAEAVLAGAFGLLASYLVVFGLDRIWQTPALVRLGILVGGSSLFAIFAPYWMHRWVFGHRRQDQLARLISRSFPKLGDRLLGTIELQDQSESAESLSPRLRSAAMENVAEEAKQRNFESALPASMHRRWSLAVLALFALSGAALTLTPRAGLNSLKRWLMPLANTPRYTFTRLANPPASLVVPYGEAFDIVLRLSDDSEWQPGNGTARYGSQQPVAADLDAGRYRFEFPGQQTDGIVRIQIGDVRHAIEVKPTLRPAAERVTATVVHPEYLGIEPRNADLRSGTLHAVEGSKVTFRLETTRALSAATIGPAGSEPGGDEIADAEPLHPTEPLAMKINGSIADSPAIEAKGRPRTLPFSWTDDLGLDGEAGFRVRLESAADAAPVAYLQGIERQRVMLAEETVEFEVLAEDDFGVREVGLDWQGEFTRPTDKSPSKGDMKLADGAPSMRRMGEPAAFSPDALGIEPQKILLRAYVEDYLPGRGRIYSEPVTLFVLTRDEHAQLLKNQFDRIIGELEDIARRELDEFDENQRLDRLDGEELQQDINQDRLQDQKEAEGQNAEQMRELTKRMQEMFKNAARNGEVDKDTMKKMAELMEDMKELGEQDMPEVEKKLGDASDPRSSEEKTDQDMQEAVEKQREVVEKMQEAIEKANEANRNFEASTFVNRLKKAASELDGVAANLIDSFAVLLGLSRDALDPKDQRELDTVVGQQSQTTSDVRWIQEDLGHFFARTEKPEHRELLDAMRDSKIDIELDKLRQRLQRNETFRSVDGSKIWAEQLREWAKQLEGDSGGGGGGGGEGAGPSPENQDFEFMLRVMRMVQQEQDLRARTRVLEQLRRSIETPNPEQP
jgi:hypothetical protein